VSVAELATLVRERQPCVALTGAGVSTESGIPDFRSRTGIWADVDPFEVASIQAFRRDPDRVWSFYRARIDLLRAAEPNAAHHALAELEHRDVVAATVTQNIDGLHTRAGSRQVVELHGSISTAECRTCSSVEALDAVVEQLAVRAVPVCSRCGGILKPSVVLFGEVLPEAAMARATDLVRSAGLVLVVGSSLEVWPAAGLPLEASAFAIVNEGPTALDAQALLKIDGRAGETLASLVRAL